MMLGQSCMKSSICPSGSKSTEFIPLVGHCSGSLKSIILWLETYAFWKQCIHWTCIVKRWFIRLKFLQPQRKIQCQGCDKTHLILFPLLFVCSFVRVDFSVTLYALDVTHCSSVSFKSCMYAHFKDNKYFYIYMQFQFFLGSGSVYNSCTAFSFV